MRVKVIGFRQHGVRLRTPALVEPNAHELQAVATMLQAAAGFDICVI